MDDQAPDRTVRRAPWTTLLAGTVCCGAGMLVAFHPTLASGFGQVQEDLGDSRLVAWLLEHTWRWLSGDPQHQRYFDPPVFFPAANTLAYSDTMFGAAPAYVPWRLVGFPADTAFQLWQLTVSGLTFCAALLFLRGGLGLRPWSSAAGAALFAFAGTRIAQVSHAQLLPHYGLPLVGYAAVKLFASPRGRPAGRWVALGAGALVLQVLAGFYLGWFTALGLLVALLWALGLRWTREDAVQRLRASWRPLVLCSLVAGAALAPLATHLWLASREVGVRSVADAVPYLPRLASWLRTSGGSWLYGRTVPWTDRFIPAGAGYEHMLGYGLLATAFGVAGLVRRRREQAFALLGLSAATLVLLTVTLHGQVTLWHLVSWLVPGAGGIRAVGRVGLLVLLPVCAGVAATLDGLEARGQPLRLGALILALLLEQGLDGRTFDKASNRRDLQWLAGRIPAGCRSFFFSADHGARPDYKYQLDAMWASMEAGVPTVNGYSGNSPPGWGRLVQGGLRAPGDRERVAEALRQWSEARALDFEARCWIAEVPVDSPGSAPP